MASVLQVSFVDDAFGSGTTLTTPSTGTGSFAAACTVGSGIEVWATCSANGTPPTLTDSAGQSYGVPKASSFNAGLGNQAVFVWTLDSNASATKLTHTITYGSAQSGKGIFVKEIGGPVAFNNAIINLQGSPGAGANVITSTAITPSVVNTFLSALSMEIFVGNGSNLAAGTNYALNAAVFWKFGGATVLAKAEESTSLLGTLTATAATFTDAVLGAAGTYATGLVMWAPGNTAPQPFYGDESELFFSQDDEYYEQSWLIEVAQSAPVGAAQPPLPVQSDEAHLFWEEYEDPVVEDSQWSGPILPNAPPQPVEDGWVDVEQLDDEWAIPAATDSAPVTAAVVIVGLQYYGEHAETADEDATDEWVGADDSAPVGPPQPPLPVEDPLALLEDDHTDEAVGVDDSAPVGADAPTPAPFQYFGEHAETADEDPTDESIGEDSAPVGLAQPPLGPDDPCAFLEEDHSDESIGEDSAPVGVNAPAAVSFQYFGQDAELADEDLTDEAVGDDSAPVGTAAAIPGPAIVVEDPLSLFDDDQTDNWDAGTIDSAPVIPNFVPVPASQFFEDPWTQFEDDNDDQTVDLQEYSAPVGPDNPPTPIIRQRRGWVPTWA